MDRVQLLKWESAAKGGDPLDDEPIPAELEPNEDAPSVRRLYFQQGVGDDVGVFVDRVGNDLKLFDITNPLGATLSNLLAGGGGLTSGTHRTLRQLIHFINEGPAEGFLTGATKTVTGGLFPTLVEWKTSLGKLIVDKQIQGSFLKPSPIVWRMYDTDGITVLATVSDAITYSGIAEASRVRTIS